MYELLRVGVERLGLGLDSGLTTSLWSLTETGRDPAPTLITLPGVSG